MLDSELSGETVRTVNAMPVVGNGLNFIGGADNREGGKPPLPPSLPDVCNHRDGVVRLRSDDHLVLRSGSANHGRGSAAVWECASIDRALGVFNAEDGPLVITVGNNAQFERFCREVIERPGLPKMRFRTNIGRAANRALLVPELEREIDRRKCGALLERLAGAGIPCGDVLGLHEALTSKRAIDAGLVTTQPHPVAGSTRVLAPPYRLDGSRPPVRRAPPTLGQGTKDVLQLTRQRVLG